MAQVLSADESGKPPREKSTEAVYQKIRAKILGNEFRPGMQVLEQELVRMFGVSRTPVREALIRLQKEHLLQIVPRHGMRVRNVSIADLREVYQVQTSLEATAAASVASKKLKGKDFRPLERACSEMERAFQRSDRGAWAAASGAFHAHLLELAGNPRLSQIVGECGDQVRRVRNLTLRLIPWEESTADAHRAIVDSLRRADPQAAARLCRELRARDLQVQIDTLQRFQILDL